MGSRARIGIRVSKFYFEYEVVVTHQRCSTSSVCGSRICTVANPGVGCFELFVVDFNMNISCAERDCVDPLIHFSPRTFRPNSILCALPWLNVMGLPFHARSKRITTTNDGWDITDAFIDEERIVLAICMAVSI